MNLALYLQGKNSMFVAEMFLDRLIKIHEKHPISTDGGGTMYPPTFRFSKLDNHLHFPLENCVIERSTLYTSNTGQDRML